MGDVTDYALAAISQAQRKVEVAGQNLANAATPAYKKRVAFSTLVVGDNETVNVPQVNIAVDNRIGKFIETGNPSDLALSTPGYFEFRRDGEVVYSRRGQLTIDADGRLVNEAGFALQSTTGNDLVVKTNKFEVQVDGSVIDKGSLVGKIAVFANRAAPDRLSANADTAIDGASVALLDNPMIKQGAIESSNVVSGDEMVAMVEALRRAESGQHIMMAYDELMGRVITSFGEGAR